MRVAVIGAGITGAVAVSHLVRLLPAGSTIECFDQGRAAGGRTSVRRVRARDGGRVVSAGEDDGVPGGGVFAWDHGCQFFRADSSEFRADVLPEWIAGKFAAEWKGRFGTVAGHSSSSSAEVPDFFGLPAQTPVFHGVGGMHAIAQGVLGEATNSRKDVAVLVKIGARVARIERVTASERAGKWQLFGTTGEAAFHDSKEEVAVQAEHVACSPEGFDALLVTDASASFEGWHRASAGLPACVSTLLHRVRARVRVPLFTALVSFASALPSVELDGITFDDDTLWFAARSASKEGLASPSAGQYLYFCTSKASKAAAASSAPHSATPAAASSGNQEGDGAGGQQHHTHHTWTLVSTPSYAVAEIQRVPMQDAATGVFIPQSEEYLQSDSGPARTLLRAFAAALAPLMGGAEQLPEVTYITAQRWGSAMPAPVNAGGRDACGTSEHTRTVLNVRYDSATRLALTPECSTRMLDPQPSAGERDFLYDDTLKVYYAGDFCSWRVPGVEAAALSGLHVAQHMSAALSRG